MIQPNEIIVNLFVGNSVCPDMAEAVIRSLFGCRMEERAAA